ncbi:MAG: hypothetical protein R3D33_18280 [Hyphomicrobiaceae bacterium]
MTGVAGIDKASDGDAGEDRRRPTQTRHADRIEDGAAAARKTKGWNLCKIMIVLTDRGVPRRADKWQDGCCKQHAGKARTRRDGRGW